MDESNVFSEQRGRLPRREAGALADYILRKEKRRLPVNIIFTDDDTLHAMNRQYRRRNRPTDVLAFPADEEMEILGEVYISIDTARRQAAEYGVTLREEVLRLVGHGVLHLCGYDHHREDEAVTMRSREEKYLTSFTTHA